MLRLIVIVCMFVVGGTAAIVSRFGALLFYLWFAIFRPQEWVWINISRYRPSLVIGALVVVPCLLRGIWPNLTHPLSLAAVAFLATTLIAQTNAISPALGWYWIDFLSKLILISLFLVTLTSTRERLLWVIAVIAGSFALHSAKAGFVSLSGGLLRFSGGLAGAYVDNNAYGVACVMVLYLLIVSAQNAATRWTRAAWWIAVPLTVVTVISTFSRAAFLALLASALTFALLQRRRLLVASVLVVALCVGAVMAPSTYRQRLETIGTYEEIGESSAMSRLHFWGVALAMSADNPLGVGLWNFESNFDKYDSLNGLYGRRMAVHNSHLQVLTEAGWIGAGLWAFLLTWTFGICFRTRRRARKHDTPESAFMMVSVANALICLMVAFVVGGFFSSMAYNDLTWLMFSTAAAMDLLSRREVKERSARPLPAAALP